MKTKALVGVSGFSYPGWKGTFYPKTMKSEEFLSYYSQKLNSVEINSSFYAPPSLAMVKSWDTKTSDKFRFSFKAPKQITHVLKLGEGAAEATQRLGTTLKSLGEKNGPILFQLPPYAKQDLKLLEDFLANTSMITERVLEFRHDSWMTDSTFSVLEKNDAAFCIAETDDMKPVLKVTGKMAYFRLRKEAYDARVINDWTDKIRETSGGTESVYVYLRHDEHGENAARALKILESLV